ncbi:MAG: hypothetical protein ACR2KT_11540 [Methylocella sp.]|nr:MAG: hypothetical protein DLM68_04690 [Hyphomicrobiales bacterium]
MSLPEADFVVAQCRFTWINTCPFARSALFRLGFGFLAWFIFVRILDWLRLIRIVSFGFCVLGVDRICAFGGLLVAGIGGARWLCI